MTANGADRKAGKSTQSQVQAVVLIHGTGAQCDSGSFSSGCGHWWHQDSPFSIDLLSSVHEAKERNEKGKKVTYEISSFSWSGKNSEFSRRLAAYELYDRVLQDFEAKEQPYHLVAHSHGGNVVWYALLLSHLIRRPLKYLRSIATVGTPFFEFERPKFRPFRRLLMVETAYFLVGTGLGFPLVFIPLAGILRGAGSPILLWLSIPALLLLTLILFQAFSWFLVRWYVYRHLKAEEEIARSVAGNFEARWVILSSKWDEAINTLRLTMPVDGRAPRLLPRLGTDWVKAWFTSRVAIVFLGLTWPPRVLYNRAIARMLEVAFWTRIVRRAQGLDLPEIRVSSVAVRPVGFSQRSEYLPERVDEELRGCADGASEGLIKNWREALGLGLQDRATLPELLDRLTERLTFKELVHNSYFSVPSIVERMAEHIVHGSGQACIDAFSLGATDVKGPLMPLGSSRKIGWPELGRAALSIGCSTYLLTAFLNGLLAYLLIMFFRRH